MAERKFHGIRAASAVDALSIAAANSLLREMRLLLADGADVNGLASYAGETALYTAASLGRTRSVELSATERPAPPRGFFGCLVAVLLWVALGVGIYVAAGRLLAG